MAPQTPSQKEAHLRRVNQELTQTNLSEERRNELLLLRTQLEDELKKTSKEVLDTTIKRLEIEQERAKVLDNAAKLEEAQLETAKASLDQLDEEIDKLLMIQNLDAKQEEALKELLKWRQDGLDLIDEYNKRAKKRNKIEEEHAAKIAKAGDFAKKLGESLGLAAKYEESMLGSTLSTLTAIGKEGEAQEAFVEQLRETFNWANILSSIFAKVFESTMAVAFAYDAAATSLNKQTGAAGKYNEVINNLGQGHRALGIGMAEVGAATGDLHAGFSDFTNLSGATRDSLILTTAKLEKLGIDGATAAKNLQTMTRAMGLSTAAAEDLSIAIAEWNIGISAAQLGADFAAVSGDLAQFGGQMMEVFKGLEKQAKATGVGIQSLVGIAKQFDTFEGAASAAGKLNALLGGPFLNSIELLTAGYEDKIAMLKQSIIESGKSWESMNRFERQSIASAAGISDMNEAAGLFSSKQTEVTEEQRQMNEMIEKSIPIMEKLKGLAASIAVTFGPWIDSISETVSKLSDWVDKNKETVQTIGTVVLWSGILLVAIKAVWAAVKVGKAVMFGYAVVTQGLAAAQAASAAASGPAAGGLIVFAEAAMFGWKGVLALGAAVLLIGIGIAVAAAGIGYMASQMKGMGLEALALVAVVGILAAAFYFMIPALGALGSVAAVAAIPMSGIALAFLAMGAGIALATLGIANMFDSMKPFLSISKDLSDGLDKISTAVASVVKSLSFVGRDKLMALGELGKAISGMTAEKSINFKASMEGFEKAVDAARSPFVLPVITGMTEFVATMGTVAPAAAGGGTPPISIARPSARAARSKPIEIGPITINLELKGREFGSAVTKVIRTSVENAATEP